MTVLARVIGRKSRDTELRHACGARVSSETAHAPLAPRASVSDVTGSHAAGDRSYLKVWVRFARDAGQLERVARPRGGLLNPRARAPRCRRLAGRRRDGVPR